MTGQRPNLSLISWMDSLVHSLWTLPHRLTTTRLPTTYTEADNSLSQDWSGNRVFLNPPYGRALKDWVKKAYEEGQKDNTMVVMLIPARTDTQYWHDYVMKADEIRFVRGRIKFGDETNSAPFPSAVVVFRQSAYQTPRITGMERL